MVSNSRIILAVQPRQFRSLGSRVRLVCTDSLFGANLFGPTERYRKMTHITVTQVFLNEVSEGVEQDRYFLNIDIQYRYI